jgi:hypothetical protein
MLWNVMMPSRHSSAIRRVAAFINDLFLFKTSPVGFVLGAMKQKQPK